MSTSSSAIFLFQRALHIWLLVWLLAALPATEWLWEHPISPELVPNGILQGLVHGFGSWLPADAALPVAILLALFAAYAVLRRPPWWMSVLIWLFFCALTDRAWLANNGGTWLMRNALFWSIVLRVGPSGRLGVPAETSFWILRLQLLLAYAITGLQKLQGTAWIDGTAMGIIALDPTYGDALIPTARSITWAVLLFQLTFPIAAWWRPIRGAWLAAGVLFHLATAFWLGIADMAFAFLVFYALWLSEPEAAWIVRRFQRSTPALNT